MSIIEVTSNSAIEADHRELIKKHGYSLVKKNSMLGGEAVWVILGTITATSITAITKVVIELIKSNASVEIEINGIKVKGISRDTVEKMLRKACKYD